MNKINVNNFYRYQIILEYIKRQRSNVKFYQLIEIGVTFVLTAFFLFVAIKPAALTISALLGEINSKQELTKQMRSKINDVIQAQDVYSQVQNEYGLINSCLPDNPRFSQGLAQVYGAIASIKPVSELVVSMSEGNSSKEIAGNSQLYRYLVPIVISTNYNQALSLIDQLMNNRRLMLMDQVSFSSIKNDTQSTIQNPGSSPTDDVTLTINPRLLYSYSINGEN
jgi:hypothetical protein